MEIISHIPLKINRYQTALTIFPPKYAPLILDTVPTAILTSIPGTSVTSQAKQLSIGLPQLPFSRSNYVLNPINATTVLAFS